MGTNMRIEGRLKFIQEDNEFKKSPEYFKLLWDADDFLGEVANQLKTRELWVVEDLDLEFTGNQLSISGAGKMQYLGVEVLLIFLACNGYEGQVYCSYDCGDNDTFVLQRGKLFSRQKEILLEELKKDKYFLL